MIKEKTNATTVVWAVDPFEGKVKPHTSEVRNFQSWMAGTGAQVQPVYILNLATSNHTNGQHIQLETEKMEDIERAIEDYLKGINFGPTLVPKVLVIRDASAGGMVDKLISYSDEVGTEMIVVSSRGRRGLDRFIFGSFTESLLLQAQCPLYFLTHQNGNSPQARGNKVLFPTDFSKHSEEVFKRFLPEAQLSGVEILIYCAVSLPFSVVSDGTIILPDYYCEQLEEDAKATGLKWVEKAATFGVKSQFIVQTVGILTHVAPSIIDMAQRESVRFIAMASNSGRVGAVFFGSIAREVFRANIFPVWICGPMVTMATEKIRKYVRSNEKTVATPIGRE